MADHLYVIKRDGTRVPVSFDQILQRIQTLSEGLEYVNPDMVAQKVCSQLTDGISTKQLDDFAAETCAMLQSRYHHNYGKLASRILMNNHTKNTPSTLLGCVEKLYHGKVQLITDKYHDLVCKYNEIYENMIDYSRDSIFDYFGFKTLEKGYLLKSDGVPVERPQHMWMRVAIQLHENDFEHVKETYDALSFGYFIHATPTLFNAGTLRPQLSSCFLLKMQEDSISGIYKTLGDCAQISKWAGGIGLAVHDIRARGSLIKGTNGNSTGIVPMLKVFNDTAKYVNQGGKRNGSFAIYLEPWHADIEDFLRLKLNQGAEEDRARDLFYALWIPDLFMKRVEEDGMWTLMCPSECPGLSESHGSEFETLYKCYELADKGRKQVPAKKIWQMILDAQIQTGTPYLCYKDSSNIKSNQQHLGTIKSSNLCVAPETMVLTKKGYFEIKSLENQVVEVWNGEQWSETVVRKTGENQKLITVNFSNGGVLTCTPYHKFILKSDRDSIKDSLRVDAQDLKVGDVLCSWKSSFSPEDMHKDISIASIQNNDRIDDTYCFNEPLNHAGVFNGILTGNCSEIVEYTSKDETAVCNLGSLALPKFVNNGKFDFEALRKYTAILARNLDIVIDKNYYPTPECWNSNSRHRPIGIGIQGLADVFAMLKLSWTSQEAADLNREIFENMYYAAIESSVKRSHELNYYDHSTHTAVSGSHLSFEGSPVSKGKLQYDLWKDSPRKTPYLNWDELKKSASNGIRNSLLIALMPTASTSQILGNNECFEPFTSNIYTRRVLAGDFVVINKYLVDDLTKLGIWNSNTRTQIIANNGSIQDIHEIPQDLKEIYKTVWEIPQKTLINMSADRAPFVCQSQSLNLFLAEPTYAKISSMHFYAWKKGLKTGCYYLRTKAASSAQKFTVDPTCLSCSA